MGKTEYAAWLLERGDCDEEANHVRQLQAQRDELLKALKTCKQQSYTDIDGDEVYCYMYDAKLVNAAIKKCES